MANKIHPLILKFIKEDKDACFRMGLVHTKTNMYVESKGLTFNKHDAKLIYVSTSGKSLEEVYIEFANTSSWLFTLSCKEFRLFVC